MEEIEKKEEMEYCTYEDFKKLDIRIGEIVAAELVQKSEKLVKCTVDFGDQGMRTILSGIFKYVESLESIIGKKVLYLYNLAPRPMMGFESQGMLLAIGDSRGNFTFMIPEKDAPNGSRIN